MAKIHQACVVGDAMIPGTGFRSAFEAYLADYVETVTIDDWESDWGKLQYRRLEVEKHGPEIEVVPEIVVTKGKGAEILMGLFVPISTKVLDALPKLKIAGVCRAGLENVNVEAASQRGVLVFNVMGRNAEAVSDFAVGLMLAESRNIARAHCAIKTGEWRKTFANSASVPQLGGKRVGIVGFGYIGQLVAKKLSGFAVDIAVYDPFVDAKTIKEHGGVSVSKEALFRESDFVTVHARLTDENKGMIGRTEFSQMKPSAYFINTGRAGLVDHAALAAALNKQRIAGAGIDVFPTEPISENDELLGLDNVTLTTHIAGTTTEALTNSPALLMEDIRRLFAGESPRYVVNPTVLENESFSQWLSEVKKTIQ